MDKGFVVNLKAVHRLWIVAGLRVPYSKKKRRSGQGKPMGGHCPLFPNVTWAMDFQFDATTNARSLKLLNIIDEYSRELLTTTSSRSITSNRVIELVDTLVAERGAPRYIRCDNGPEFIAKAIRNWAEEMGVTLYYIEPGSPWQNGRCESFNSILRDELLNGELFDSPLGANILSAYFKDIYNNERPHSSLGHLSPKEFLELDTTSQRIILTRSSKSRKYYARQFFKNSGKQDMAMVS